MCLYFSLRNSQHGVSSFLCLGELLDSLPSLDQFPTLCPLHLCYCGAAPRVSLTWSAFLPASFHQDSFILSATNSSRIYADKFPFSRLFWLHLWGLFNGVAAQHLLLHPYWCSIRISPPELSLFLSLLQFYLRWPTLSSDHLFLRSVMWVYHWEARRQHSHVLCWLHTSWLTGTHEAHLWFT